MHNDDELTADEIREEELLATYKAEQENVRELQERLGQQIAAADAAYAKLLAHRNRTWK